MENKDDILEAENEKTLKDLFKKLEQAQTGLHLFKAVEFTRKTKTATSTKIKNIGEYLNEQAKIYGQNSDLIQEIKEKYEKSITDLRKSYNIARKKLVEKQTNYEAIEAHRMGELKLILTNKSTYVKSSDYATYQKEKLDFIKEINNALENDDFITANRKQSELQEMYRKTKIPAYDSQIQKIQSKINEARNLISQTKEEIKNLEDTFNQNILNEQNHQERELASIKKPNAFSKFIGSIFKKIGGSKKFTNDIITPLSKNIEETNNNIAKMNNNTEIQQNAEASYSEIILSSSNSKKQVLNAHSPSQHDPTADRTDSDGLEYNLDDTNITFNDLIEKGYIAGLER